MHRLQKLLTGIKRLAPTRQLERFPTTIQILHSIRTYLQPDHTRNVDHVMLWAAYTLAFFGFIRSSEFICNAPFDPSVHLTSSDITLLPNCPSLTHMLVRIKLSKTDPFQAR